MYFYLYMKYKYIIFRLSNCKIILLIIILFSLILLFILLSNKYIVKSDIDYNIDNIISTNNIVSNLENDNIKIQEVKINGFNVIGKIKIPKINLDTYILELTNEESLKEGVTKFYGGNINTQGNFCIAGHNFRNDKMFGDLYKVKIGDKIIIEDSYKRSLEYIVYDVYKTSPKDLTCLKESEEGNIEITLITCTTAAIKRLIVKAKVIYE